MIEINGVTMRYGGVTALDQVTLRFPMGTNGLIGPNGSGKTTMFNVLSGFVEPAEGSITAFGTPLLAMSSHRRARWGLRRTFQTEQTIGELSVFDNVAMVLEHAGGSRKDLRHEVNDALGFVGLADFASTPAAKLNARERRILELGRAVVGTPRVVLLDEPAAGMTEEETVELVEIIRRIPGERGALVILVDHDMSLVSAVLRDDGRPRLRQADRGRGHGGCPARSPGPAGLPGNRGAGMTTATTSGPNPGAAVSGLTEAPAGVLRIEGLVVGRGGKRVLRDVSIDVAAGEVTSLLGSNGAGKSSLVLAVGGLLPVEAGRVLVDGIDIVGLPPEQVRAAGVAIVPEGRKVLRELTIADNLRVATYAQRPADAKASTERALELFPELKPRLKVAAGAVSGGEQQMVCLAQAVASNPRYLFVDELSLGLAPVVVKRLVPVLAHLAATGVGVLLIEQFAQVALSVAATAYVLGLGEVHYAGSTAALRDNPDILRSAYLAAG